MSNGETQQKFQRLANEFKSAADFYFTASEPSKQAKVVTALRESLRQFTKKAKKSMPSNLLNSENRGCPPGWKPCEDGSCVPQDENCPPPRRPAPVEP
jgi:hypothetical protein